MSTAHYTALVQQGLALHRQGQFADAERIYNNALKSYPKSPDLHHLKGLISYQLKDYESAIDAIQHAIDLSPQESKFYNSLANVYQDQGILDVAIQLYQTSLKLKPEAQTMINLASAYRAQNNVHAAGDCLKQALGIFPNHGELLFQTGKILADTRQYTDALIYLQRCIQLMPQHLDALALLGCLNQKLNRLEDAIGCFEAMRQMDANHPVALTNLGILYFEQGSLEIAYDITHQALKAISVKADRTRLLSLLFGICCASYRFQERQSIEQQLADNLKDTNQDYDLPPFRFLASALSTETLKKICQHRSRQLARSLINLQNITPWSAYQNEVARPVGAIQRKRIRIAYLSSDFNQHAVGWVIKDLFRYHDRTQFEIWAIDIAGKSDFVNQCIEKGVEHYCDFSTLSLEDIILCCRRLSLDVAIDLNGYTKGHCAQVFSARIADVQINYLGFLESTQSCCYDYTVMDTIIAKRLKQCDYQEKWIMFDHVFTAFSPLEQNAIENYQSTANDWGLPANQFVFASFNHPFKIDLNTFLTWIEILKCTPNSVLWLYCPEQITIRMHLQTIFKQHGISSERLIFADKLDFYQNASRFAHADLFLDSHCYHAGATSQVAYWMGLPILLTTGNRFCNVMGESFARGVGLSDFVANDRQSYIEKARQFSQSKDELNIIKASLRQRIQEGDAVLFDIARFVIEWENRLRLIV